MASLKPQFKLCTAEEVKLANVPLLIVNQLDGGVKLFFIRDLRGDRLALKKYHKLSVGDLVKAIPALPEGKNTIHVMASEVPELSEGEWIYHSIYQIDEVDDILVGDEVDIEIFSQDGSTPLSSDTLTFPLEAQLLLSEAVLDAFKANVETLLEHSKIVRRFTK